MTFDQLDEADWQRLREVGTFRVEPITFQSWNNRLADDGKESVDKISQLLTHHYRGYRIIIRGHTGPGGDEAANVPAVAGAGPGGDAVSEGGPRHRPDRLLAGSLALREPPRRKAGRIAYGPTSTVSRGSSSRRWKRIRFEDPRAVMRPTRAGSIGT